MLNICRDYILQEIIQIVKSQYAELRNSEEKKQRLVKHRPSQDMILYKLMINKHKTFEGF